METNGEFMPLIAPISLYNNIKEHASNMLKNDIRP